MIVVLEFPQPPWCLPVWFAQPAVIGYPLLRACALTMRAQAQTSIYFLSTPAVKHALTFAVVQR